MVLLSQVIHSTPQKKISDDILKKEDEATIQEFCILKPLLEENQTFLQSVTTFAKSMTQFHCENLISPCKEFFIG